MCVVATRKRLGRRDEGHGKTEQDLLKKRRSSRKAIFTIYARSQVAVQKINLITIYARKKEFLNELKFVGEIDIEIL